MAGSLPELKIRVDETAGKHVELDHLPGDRGGEHQPRPPPPADETHRPPVHPGRFANVRIDIPDRANHVGYLQTPPLSISPSHPRPFVIALADEPKLEGNDWSRVGPHRASTNPPSGAKSDWHTQRGFSGRATLPALPAGRLAGDGDVARSNDGGRASYGFDLGGERTAQPKLDHGDPAKGCVPQLGRRPSSGGWRAGIVG